MYTKEQRMEVLDYHFADPTRTLTDTIAHFGFPQTRTLHYWISQDPRGKAQSRTTRRNVRTYTKEQKAYVLNYYRNNPDLSCQDVVKEVGYPSVTCLSKWLDEAGIEKRNPRTNNFFTKEQKRRVCEYAVAHPEKVRHEVCALFGYPANPSTLNKWCEELYGEDGRPQGPYTNDEKTRAVELCFSQPDRAIKEIARDYGFPVPVHVVFPLLQKDPRWADDPRNPVNKHKLRQEITEYYFEDLSRRFSHVAEHFNYRYTPSGIAKIIMKDPRFGNPEFYGFTSAQRDAVLDLHFENLSLRLKDIIPEVGFRVSTRVYYEWRILDPRTKLLPKKPRFLPKSFAEKYACVSLVVKQGLSREAAAAQCNVVKATVTNWLRSYRRKGLISLVAKRDLPPKRRLDLTVPDKKPSDYTEQDIEALRARNKELEFENDVLRAIFDVLKKEPGLNENSLSNREKALIINSLRPKYRLHELLQRLGMAKSSYEYAARALERKDKYDWLRPIVAAIYEESRHSYGYRRIWGKLRRPVSQGGYSIRVSEKVIRRITKEENLITLPAKKLTRYNSYRGKVGKIAPNLLKRNFKADKPHEKLLTDITEFHLNDFKMYLSPLIDCYNGEVVAYTISKRPQLSLVMKMLNLAMKEIEPGKKPIVHSDQGGQYQSHTYVKALKDAGWVQSMSRKGCCSDNSACEGFFGKLKNEFFYNHDFSEYSSEAFATALSEWIDWYNNERLKESLGYRSPVEYRLESYQAAA